MTRLCTVDTERCVKPHQESPCDLLALPIVLIAESDMLGLRYPHGPSKGTGLLSLRLSDPPREGFHSQNPSRSALGRRQEECLWSQSLTSQLFPHEPARPSLFWNAFRAPSVPFDLCYTTVLRANLFQLKVDENHHMNGICWGLLS